MGDSHRVPGFVPINEGARMNGVGEDLSHVGGYFEGATHYELVGAHS